MDCHQSAFISPILTSPFNIINTNAYVNRFGDCVISLVERTEVFSVLEFWQSVVLFFVVFEWRATAY